MASSSSLTSKKKFKVIEGSNKEVLKDKPLNIRNYFRLINR